MPFQKMGSPGCHVETPPVYPKKNVFCDNPTRVAVFFRGHSKGGGNSVVTLGSHTQASTCHHTGAEAKPRNIRNIRNIRTIRNSRLKLKMLKKQKIIKKKEKTSLEAFWRHILWPADTQTSAAGSRALATSGRSPVMFFQRNVRKTEKQKNTLYEYIVWIHCRLAGSI